MKDNNATTKLKENRDGAFKTCQSCGIHPLLLRGCLVLPPGGSRRGSELTEQLIAILEGASPEIDAS